MNSLYRCAKMPFKNGSMRYIKLPSGSYFLLGHYLDASDPNKYKKNILNQ